MSEPTSNTDANHRFEFSSAAYDTGTFSVITLDGHESISRIYRFELVLVSHDAAIDLDQMLRADATLRILPPDPGGTALPYHGVLAEFDQLHQVGGYNFYRAVLVPRLWRLSLSETSDVFLDEQSIPRIVEGILRKHQFGGDDYTLKLKGNYRDRSYVCQYKESDLDFIMRWLEKEGIYFYFEHDGQREKLVVLDDRILQPASTRAVNYCPIGEPGTNEADDAVQTFMCQQRPLPAEVVLQDYNPRNAQVALSVPVPVAPHGFGKVVLYGENFRSPEEGARYARIRAEEIACNGRVFSGEATATGLRSGCFVTLSNHFRSDFNGEYLITEVSHHGSQAGALLAHIDTPYKETQESGRIVYQCTFRATSGDTQYRPARVTSKPTVAGTLSAIVDAEGSGQFAELDEYGQYKVQLTFDQTDKQPGHGSARIRMASPYAGTDHGMHFPLHKDTEVLLSFTDGDPDQPVILSAVPNSDTRNVVTRDSANLSRIATKGGNQVFMSDTPGSESTWLHSPHNNSHIVIGALATAADGSDTNDNTKNDGLSFVTLGSTNLIQVGGLNRVSLGPSHTVLGNTETSFSLSAANRIALGLSSTISVARDLKWTCEGSRSYVIDEGKTKAIKEDSATRFLGGFSVSAGVVPQELPVKDGLDVLRQRTKNAVLAITGVNMALGAAMGGTLGGIEKKADGKSVLPGNPTAIGTMVADMAGNLLTTGAGLHAASRIAGELTEHYTALKPVSDMTLDVEGIELKVDLSATPGYLGRSSFKMHSDILLRAGGPQEESAFKLSADGANLSYGEGLRISLSRPEFVPHAAIEVEQQTVKVNRYKTVVESGADSKLSVEPYLIKSAVGAGTCEITSQEVKLEAGSRSGVSVTPMGIALKFPGGSASYEAGMIRLDGDTLIKLG